MNLRQELKRLTNQMSQESGWYETDDCDMLYRRAGRRGRRRGRRGG